MQIQIIQSGHVTNQTVVAGMLSEWLQTKVAHFINEFCLLEIGQQQQKKTVKNKQKQILIIRKNATFLIWRSAKLMIGRSLLYLLGFFPCESQREPCRNHHSWILSQTQSWDFESNWWIAPFIRPTEIYWLLREAPSHCPNLKCSVYVTSQSQCLASNPVTVSWPRVKITVPLSIFSPLMLSSYLWCSHQASMDRTTGWNKGGKQHRLLI